MMTQTVSAFGGLAGASALRKLSQRRDLPLRVRHLLAGVLGLSNDHLERALVAALDEFEQELLQQAGKSRSAEQSQRCFESLRQVKRTRADVTPRFRTAIEDMLARFDQPGQSRGSEPAKGQPLQSEELALMDAGELEETLALQEIAVKSEVRQAQMLHDLGHRFAVLAGLPVFDADNVPLGPVQITRALRHACGNLNIPAEHRIMLYRSCDRVAIGEIATFYAALNAFFAEHRILRHLRVHAPPRARSKGSHAEDGANPAARTAPNDGTPAHGPTEAAAQDPELFATLRELLAGRRKVFGVPKEKPGARTYVPSAADMQAVLGMLQSGASAPVKAGGMAVPRSVADLKQDLLAQLRRHAPAGHSAQLTSEDSDTIDLVGMLFDYIAKATPAQGNTQALLAQLQVPLLRVALSDKGFFTHRSHPARLLLNAIAETGIHWIDQSEGASDPALLKKMHTVIERLNHEFDGDLSLIERMLGDLSQHMHTLAHKAEVAERRLVDASKGREKLALARETAGDAVARRIAEAKPGRLLRTMLEQAWTDVLALTLLRQGEHSDAYTRQLAVVDQLIAAGRSRGTDKPAVAELRREVERGLGQVGYHHDEIQAVVRHLLAPEELPEEDEGSSQTSLAIRLKAKAHLGKTGAEQRPTHAAGLRKSSLHLSPEEERMLERLKTIPYGTWFEFAINQQGDRVRRKLSWYSTVTGHCLFVDQRGTRAAERSLEQLAREVVRGQANIAKPGQESLVDRAWKAIVSSLRQLTARGAESPPEPA